jgi:site-specific DNA-cytosine methylase
MTAAADSIMLGASVLEIFSCSGGMAEGFRRVGLPIDMAFDWNEDARASYEANFGHAPIGIDARDLIRMVEAGWSPGAIELLVADPPCTPWSRAGKRQGQADERDMLAVTCDLVRRLRQGFPESWVFFGKTKASRWSQIGQAMPPPLAAAVASSIAAWLARVSRSLSA